MTTTGGRFGQPGVFTRASSGLVRQVGTLDTAFYGMMQIGIPYIIFIIAAWVSYPGSSMELATAITIIGSRDPAVSTSSSLERSTRRMASS